MNFKRPLLLAIAKAFLLFGQSVSIACQHTCRSFLAGCRYARPRDPPIAYCQGTPLKNEIEVRDASRLEDATQKAAEALARRFGSGPTEGRIRAHVIIAAR